MQELSDGTYSTLSERPSSKVLDPPQNQREPGSQRSSGAGSWQQASEELYSEDGDGNWENAEEHPQRKSPDAAMPEKSLTGPSQEESYKENDEDAGPHPPPLTQAPSLDDSSSNSNSSSSYAMSSGSDAEEGGPGELSLAAQAAALEDSYTSEPQPSLPLQASDESNADQEGGTGASPGVQEERRSSSSSSSSSSSTTTTTGSAGEPHPPHIPHPRPPPPASPAGSSMSADHRSPRLGHASLAPNPPGSRSEKTTEQGHPDSHPAEQSHLTHLTPPSISPEHESNLHQTARAPALEQPAAAAAAPGSPGPHPHPAQQGPPGPLTDQEEGPLDNRDVAAAAAHAQPHSPPTQQTPSSMHENDEDKCGGGQDPGLVSTAAAAHTHPHASEARHSPNLLNTNPGEGAGRQADQGAAAEVGAYEQPPSSPSEQEGPGASCTSAHGNTNQGAAAAAAAAAEVDPFPPPPVPHPKSSKSSAEGGRDKDADPGTAAAPAGDAPPPPHPTSRGLPREEEERGQTGQGAVVAAATEATPTDLSPVITQRAYTPRLYDAEEVDGHVSHGAAAARSLSADVHEPADVIADAGASPTPRTSQAPPPTQQGGQEASTTLATDAISTGMSLASQPRHSSGTSGAPRTTESQSQGAPHMPPHAMPGPVASPQLAPGVRSHNTSGSYSEDEWAQQQQLQVQHAPPTSFPHPTAPAPDSLSQRASSSAYSMDDFTNWNEQQQLQQQPLATAKQASPFLAAAAASQHAQIKQQQQQQQQQPLLSRRRQGRPAVPFIRDMPPPSSATQHKLPPSVNSTSPQPWALSMSPRNSLEVVQLPKPRASSSRPFQSGSAHLHPGQHKTSSPRSTSQNGLPTLSMTIPPLPPPISKSPQYSSTAYWPPPACCMPPPPPAAPRPPRARHSLQHVDPAYLQAPMTPTPWGGKLYNWEAHHNQNLNLLRTRQKEVHDARVQEAMKAEASIQQQSQERFQAWVRRKKGEREEQIYEVQHLIHPSNPNWSPQKRDPPEVLAAREQEWKPPAPFDQDAWRVIQRVKHMKRPGTVANL